MTELPIVVNMTVDASRTEYDLTAESNLEEIELLNDTVIETGGSHVPVYEGPYTIDAGLTAVTLDTDGKRMAQDVTVNALEAMTLNAPTISVNSSNGQITASVNYTPGYNDVYVVAPTMVPLSTQARATITPTVSEQTAVARGKYTTGAIKVRAISSPYADVSGVTATAGDVLSGKYFVDSSGVLTLGTGTGGGGMDAETKDALLECFEHVAWADNDGQIYYNNLLNALYPLQSISAVYTQSGDVYTDTPLNDLKSDLVVTATFEDGTVKTVTNYTLSGTLAVGTSTVTVTYFTETTTFSVTVSDEAFTYGLVDNSSAVTGSYIDENGVIQTGTSASGYYRDYIKVSSLSSVVVGFSGSIYNYRISIYDASKTFIRQIHIEEANNIKSAYWLVDFNSGESYIRLGWYATSPVFYLLDATPVSLPMQIGDINGTTGEDITQTKRIRTVDYIPVCGAPNAGKVAVTGCPFATTWSDWITSAGNGYFFRCYDSSYNILGTLIGGSSQMFMKDILQTPTTGTAYVRMICQQGNSNIPSGFATNATRFIIDGVVYLPTEVS